MHPIMRWTSDNWSMLIFLDDERRVENKFMWKKSLYREFLNSD